VVGAAELVVAVAVVVCVTVAGWFVLLGVYCCVGGAV
jgi:hypothetical protein